MAQGAELVHGGLPSHPVPTRLSGSLDNVRVDPHSGSMSFNVPPFGSVIGSITQPRIAPNPPTPAIGVLLLGRRRRHASSQARALPSGCCHGLLNMLPQH